MEKSIKQEVVSEVETDYSFGVAPIAYRRISLVDKCFGLAFVHIGGYISVTR